MSRTTDIIADQYRKLGRTEREARANGGDERQREGLSQVATEAAGSGARASAQTQSRDRREAKGKPRPPPPELRERRRGFPSCNLADRPHGADGRRPRREAVEFTIPVRTVSETNAHEHWRVRQKRAKAQRLAVFLATVYRICPDLPVTVTMTRVGKRLLDDDNLQSSLKHVRDQIAARYGCGDAPGGPIEWKYEQKTGKEFAVVVKIERTA